MGVYEGTMRQAFVQGVTSTCPGHSVLGYKTFCNGLLPVQLQVMRKYHHACF